MIPFRILEQGYQPVLASIGQAIQTGRVPHAWLFSGPKGVGKRTLSLAVAHWLLGNFSSFEEMVKTLNPGHPLVRHIDQNCHPELEILSAQASVHEVRALKSRFGQTSLTPTWRVGLILEVQDLSLHSLNALLKLIETPPPKTVFLLTTTGGAARTLTSRCAHQPMKPLSPEAFSEVARLCEGENLPQESLFTYLCQGCVGRIPRVKALFPLGQQMWDVLSASAQQAFVIPGTWKEEVVTHLPFFQEVFFLWCHHWAVHKAYQEDRFLHFSSFVDHARALFEDHAQFHTDGFLLLQSLCASIRQIFAP